MGKEQIRLKNIEYRNMLRWKNEYLLNEFCNTWKANPQDILSYCEGIDNFEEWYADFIKYVRDETQYRMDTGMYRPIDFKDVWGGGRWIAKYI